MTAMIVGLLAASLVRAAPAKIGPSAVFNPLMGAMADLRESCDKERGSEALKACLLRFMKGNGHGDGVDPAAVAFTRALDEPGFLREFIRQGKVDLGRVHFPWRANFNDTVYFLNGEPPMQDAYGAAMLSKLRLPGGGLLFPDGYALPKRIPTFTGIRYVADVPIRRCRACAEEGAAKLAWDFTDQGKYLGVKLLSTAAPGARTPGKPRQAGRKP